MNNRVEASYRSTPDLDGARSGGFGNRLLAYWRRIGLGRIRLFSGLVLFTYVTLHLVNHALGNISIEAMEAGLYLQKLVWQGVLGTILLYGALVVHFSLALWSVFQRRHYGWDGGKVAQAVLGLLIPVLLANHMHATRIAFALDGTEKGYAQELYAFFIKSRFFGNVQFAGLLVAWCHGCFGVYYWLRLKPIFKRLAPALGTVAVVLPVVSLLGTFQGGNLMMMLAQDPAWRAVNLTPDHVGTPAGNARLADMRDTFLWGYGLFVLFIFAARGVRPLWQRRRGTIFVTYTDGTKGRSVRAARGMSVLETSLLAGVPHAHVCGGRGRCSTCRVRIIGTAAPLPPPSLMEQAVLARVGAMPGTRLACQLRPTADIAVAPLLSAQTTASGLSETLQEASMANVGERFIAVVVVEMRNPEALGNSGMAYDTVFAVDRFIKVIGSAIEDVGGRLGGVNGDGVIGLFGTDTSPEQGCREAIRSVKAIGQAVVGLNVLLDDKLGGEMIRCCIGVHCGKSILGQVGYARTKVFTSFGEPAFLAARLHDLCKEYEVEAIISEAVCMKGGLQLPDAIPRREVMPRDFGHPVSVRMVSDIAKADFSAMNVTMKVGANPAQNLVE